MALRWPYVDLAAGLIRVERGWDDKEGPIAPKTAKGRRKVPIAAVLRDYLVEHRMRQGRYEGLVFGGPAPRRSPRERSTDGARKPGRASSESRCTRRGTLRLTNDRGRRERQGAQTYMGHGNISITLDRYGHLMPGNEDEAAGLLDSYLERANTTARAAVVA